MNLDDVLVLRCNNYSEELVKSTINTIIKHFDIEKEERIVIKPNLCLPEDYSLHLTTHPEIIRQLGYILIEKGISNIIIADTPVGKSDNIRREKLWKKTGMKSIVEDLNLIRNDLDDNLVLKEMCIEGVKTLYPLSRDIIENKVINIPKFKTHGFMLFTGAVKNLYGILPEYTKKRLHRELEKKEAFSEFLVEFANSINPIVNIMDAIIGIEGEGPGRKGSKRYIGVVLASNNVFALDYVAAQIMGIDPGDVPTVRRSLEKKYIEKERIRIIGDPIEQFILKDYKLPIINERTDRLSKKLFHLSRYNVWIESEKCYNCAMCKKSCPHNAIVYEGIMKIDSTKCKACLVCHEICPAGAICFSTYSFLEELSKKEAETRKDREKEWFFIFGNPKTNKIILRLKQYGYLVALIHDKVLQVDANDCDFEAAEITKAQAEKFNIRGALNYHSEANVLRCAKFCAMYNIPGISVSCAEILSDKAKLKIFLEKNGIKYPKYQLYTKTLKLYIDPEKQYVIKPIDNSNSAGVYLVKGSEITAEILEKSLLQSKKGFVLVEEFIDGEEYDITCIVSENEVKEILINKRLRVENSEDFGQVIGFQTVRLSIDNYEKLKNICTRSIQGLKIEAGIISFQMILNSDWYLIEMAGRAMGGGLAEFLYAVSNINIDEILVELSLGKRIDYILKRRKNKHGAFLYANHFIKGISVGKIDIKKMSKSKGVLWNSIHIIEGVNNSIVEGGIFCFGKDNDDALKNCYEAIKKINIT